ncbi:MAG: hypothetical protein ACI9G9_000229 [Psychromonas sp.]|jgi:hypothetical protein
MGFFGFKELFFSELRFQISSEPRRIYIQTRRIYI